MVGIIAPERFILGSSRRLVTDKIGISTAQTRRTNSFMGIHHNLMLGGFGQCIKIMIDHPLSVMMFPTRYNISHISTLHGIIAMIVHKLICFLHVPFIITNRARGLMMHNHFHSLRFGVLLYFFYIEIGIRCDKIEYIVFRLTYPIFPPDVPTFHQHSVKSMFCGKIDIFFYMLGISGMTSIRRQTRIIDQIEFHMRQIGISPSTFPGYHFPPYTYIFRRFYPTRIFIDTRFIQIKGHFGCKNITRIVTNNNRAPRRFRRSLHISLIPQCIGCKVRLEYHIFVVQIERHTRIIDQCSFM